MTTFGKLRIVASNSIGPLGPEHGKAVLFTWSILPVLLTAFGWAILLPLFLLKANRKIQAWFILLPVVGIHALLFLLHQELPGLIPSTGLGALFLLAPWIASHKKARTFFLVLAILAVVVVWSAFCHNGFRFSNDELFRGRLLICGIVSGIVAMVILVSLAIAGIRTRKQHPPYLFVEILMLSLARWLALILLALWTLILTFFLSFAPLFAIPMVIEGLFFDNWSLPGMIAVFWIPIVLVSYFITLPFLVLAKASPFYRNRLGALFGVEAAGRRGRFCQERIRP